MPSEIRVATGTATTAELSSNGDLTVCVGAPASARALPGAGLLLVVEADQDIAEQLTRDLRQQRDVRVCAEVLTAQSATPVTWFHFNAPRLNGPLTAERWREVYPNLRQTGEEARVGRRLADLLDDFTAHHDLRQRPSLRLHLRQGDPLAVLGGLGDWMAALQEVELAMPGAREVWVQPVASWLKERGFGEVEDTATRWRRDPVATQRLLLEEKEQRIAQLEAQLASQAELLREAQTRNEELSAACDQLRTSLDGLAAEREAVLRERDEQRARAESLALQFEGFNDELDKLLRKMDQDLEGIGWDRSPDPTSSLAEDENGSLV